MQADEFINARINRGFVSTIEGAAYHSKEVAAAASVFKQNLLQVEHLQSMPAWICNATAKLAENWCDAVEKETGHRQWSGTIESDRALYDRIIKSHQSLHAEKMATGEQDADELSFGGSLRLLHVEFMYPEIPLEAGFEAIGKSMLIYAWTAFEVLTHALYVAAIRTHPKEHFTSVQKIVSAFKTAFDPNNTSIQTAVNNDAVRAVALLRHLIVHKAGVIDRKFLKQSSGIKSLKPIRDCGLNTPISINGKMVVDFIDPLNAKACALISAVDAWIIAKPSWRQACWLRRLIDALSTWFKDS